MLVTMKEMLIEARKRGYAVGAFEFWSYDSAKAIVETADRLGMPVILQVGHFERDYMDGYVNARRIADMMAELYPNVSIALHLDHAETYEEVKKALDANFTSVMIDASAKPFEENIALTRSVVEMAAKYGASTEAELGTLSGNEGLIEGMDLQTNPEQAREFVKRTGVDCLAVAIGTAHGFYTETPKINIERLKEIAKIVDIPLVLHGGSGTPEVNICTELIAAFGKRMSAAQTEDGFKYNVWALFREGMMAGEALVEKKMRLFNPDNVVYREK